jgi:hypothetical protein
MKRRIWLFPLLALALLTLATLTCNRSTQGEPTLVPTIGSAPVTVAATTTNPVSPSPTPIATATATATPTPTPTSLPIVLIQEAETARDNGDYAAAQALYQTLSLESLTRTLAPPSRHGVIS